MNTSPIVPGPVPEESGTADLFDYAALRRWAAFVLGAVLRHRALAAAVFLGVVAASLLALRVMPMRYQVQATILTQQSPIMGSLSNPGLNRDWDIPGRSAREVVLRHDNLVSLCRQTNFVERYLETRAPIVRARDWLLSALGRRERTRDELTEDLIDSLERRIWVESSDSGTITLTFEWSNRELAYDMVAAALQSFLEARRTSEISMVGETVTILESHATRVKQAIEETVPRLEQIERRVRSTPQRSPAAVRSLAPDEETLRLETSLAARRRALADLEEYRGRRVAELQSELSQSLTQFRPEHPAVLATRRNIESMSAPSSQIETLRTQIREMEREFALRGRDSRAPSGSSSLALDLAALAPALPPGDPRADYERDQLRFLLREYSMLVDRLDSARVELDTARAAFKYRYSVVTPPQMPRSPVKPRPRSVVLGGILGGLALALFAATVMDLVSGRIVESWQIEHRFGIPVLAEIGEPSGRSESARSGAASGFPRLPG